MNDFEKHIEWEILAHRFLSGEATAAEQEDLLAWVALSPENKERYLSFKRIYDGAQAEKNESLFNVDASFKQFLSETEGEAPALTPSVVAFDFYAKIGVAVAIVGVLFSVLYFFRPVNFERIVVASADSVKNVFLVDSSTVTLNQHSAIAYNADFNKTDRTVELVSGEAFFDIAHNAEKPFVVFAGDIKVEVIGTSFNLNYDSLAKHLEIAVSSGTVRVCSKSCADSLVLTKGYVANYDGLQCRTDVANPPYQNQHGWRTRKLVFADTPMDTVVDDLNDLYRAKFVLSDSMKNCRFNAKMENLSLEDVIAVLEMTFDAQIDLQDSSVYYIHGNRCD